MRIGGIWALLLALVGTARAQDSRRDEARQQYQEGTKLYDLGRFDDAIRKYEEAYRLYDDPAILYNIAQAHRLAHHNERAIFFYRSFLRRAPDTDNRSEVEGHINELQSAMPTRPVALPKDAPSAPPPMLPPKNEKPAATYLSPAAATSSVIDLERGRGRSLRTAGLSLAGAGMLGVIAGIVASIVAKKDSDAVTGESTNGMRYDPSKSSQGELADKLGIVLDCIGGAAVVAGVVVAVLGYRARSRHVTFAPVVRNATLGIGVVGGF
jgi:tetratricopeptide (TPR) repeat protein